MNQLICDGISVDLNQAKIVDNVSFTLEPGSIVALIGPNGSGKTTLLNAISGIQRPSGGQVRLGASIFTSLPRHLLAQIGVFRSFQEGRLFESLSAAENLAAALRPAPDERLLSALVPIFASNAELTGRRFAMSATLQAIGMEPARDRCAREMSYGMRKRTILGQARVSNSVVCLLDEPLAGIDPVTRDKMISFIATLRNANRIVLFVEHDLDAVRCLADRTLLMDRGRLVGDGLVDEIFAGKAFLEAYLQSYVQ